jgi:NAD(P)-dependent dehydrogenase (short-subunit alcohol dehydrogenase family)
MTMRTGLVLGASGGIGSACARALAGSVDRLVLVGRDRERLAGVAETIGPAAMTLAADVSTPQGREAIVDAVSATDVELGWVVLASGRPLRGPLAELDEAAIAETFAVNLVGPALLLRRLSDAPWAETGSVVVIGSISSTRVLPGRGTYAATKAGLEQLAMGLAVEWAPRGIAVSVVAPGVIATPFLGQGLAGLDDWLTQRVPAGRAGTADEVAEVVRWLCIDAPPYVLGTRIRIDGGTEVSG